MTKNQPADGTVIGRVRGEQADYRPGSPTHGRPYDVLLVADAQGDHLRITDAGQLRYRLRREWL